MNKGTTIVIDLGPRSVFEAMGEHKLKPALLSLYDFFHLRLGYFVRVLDNDPSLCEVGFQGIDKPHYFPVSQVEEAIPYTVWPDSMWCEADDLEQYSHKSDDFTTIHLPSSWDAERVDTYVHILNGHIKLPPAPVKLEFPHVIWNRDLRFADTHVSSNPTTKRVHIEMTNVGIATLKEISNDAHFSDLDFYLEHVKGILDQPEIRLTIYKKNGTVARIHNVVMTRN